MTGCPSSDIFDRPVTGRRLEPGLGDMRPEGIAQVAGHRRLVLTSECGDGLIVVRGSQVTHALAHGHGVHCREHSVAAHLEAARVEGDQRPAGDRHIWDDRGGLAELPERVADQHARGDAAAEGARRGLDLLVIDNDGYRV